MPPKRRGGTHNAQPAPQPVQSDFDDTDAVTDYPPNLPPPPPRSDVELNLTVLRRYSPDIERILAIAPFAVVYIFSAESQQWEKCGIEGTLFACHLTDGRYNAIILNRKSLDNFITELVSADDIQVTDEYVILQALNSAGEPQIYGIWIFSDGETVPSTKEVMARTIQACALQAQISREGVADVDDGYVEKQDYGMGGTAQVEEQMEEEEAVAQQSEQKLDLLQLFGSKSAQEVQQPPLQIQPSMTTDVPPSAVTPAMFTATTDTDFFRKTSSPAIAQPQPAPPPQQKNALLDLFKK
ncbi:hypothetical protein LTR86_003057 [Recurvomyces mirabilis]|nr:hypothetical protein LTR86_003057 [Recurvomyces mirabilis]